MTYIKPRRIYLCIALLLFVSMVLTCCSPKITRESTRIEKQTDTTTITIRERIVDTFIASDTFTTYVYLKCDSNKNVFIDHQKTIDGKRSHSKISLVGNLLTSQNICAELKIQIALKDSTIKALSKKIIDSSTTITIEKKVMAWYGWLIIILCLGITLFTIIKK